MAYGGPTPGPELLPCIKLNTPADFLPALFAALIRLIVRGALFRRHSVPLLSRRNFSCEAGSLTWISLSLGSWVELADLWGALFFRRDELQVRALQSRSENAALGPVKGAVGGLCGNLVSRGIR